MPVSTQSFQDRVARIEAGKTPHSKELAKRSVKSRGRGKLSLGFFVGVGILTGGTAYAWAANTDNLHWVATLAASLP